MPELSTPRICSMRVRVIGWLYAMIDKVSKAARLKRDGLSRFISSIQGASLGSDRNWYPPATLANTKPRALSRVFLFKLAENLLNILNRRFPQNPGNGFSAERFRTGKNQTLDDRFEQIPIHRPGLAATVQNR